MKRITPQEVLEAYEKTGLKPMQGDYYPQEGCACGMGAIATSNGYIDTGLEPFYSKLFRKYGTKYHDGFTHGFDGGTVVMNNENFIKGHTDGKAAWEAVKHLAEVKT
jgi:hypothetical protein